MATIFSRINKNQTISYRELRLNNENMHEMQTRERI